jgi:hypothetical protein
MAGCPKMVGVTVIDGDGVAACASERRRRTGVAGRVAGRAQGWWGAGQGTCGGGGAYGQRRARAGGERG